MAQGRLRAQWQQTATICTILANANRDKKKRARPFEPNDFIPAHLRAKNPKPPMADITVLKALLIKRT